MPSGMIHGAPVTAQLFSKVCRSITASTYPHSPYLCPSPSSNEAFSLQDNDSEIESCHWIMVSCG